MAIIDHRMHVLVGRGVAINDHRVGAGKIMELKGHRIGRRGVDGDIVRTAAFSCVLHGSRVQHNRAIYV